MPKYSSEQRKALAEAGQRLGLNRDDRNVAPLKRKSAPQVKEKRPVKACSIAKESDIGRRDRLMQQYGLTPLRRASTEKQYDTKDVTRYPAVNLPGAGEKLLEGIRRRYGEAMKSQGITPTDLRMWREHFLLMTPEQLAALVRVTPRTIRDWEKGRSRIPFSMWWMVHVTMQDPEYFLTRPGFHDFYIEYDNGTPLLCSWTYPDIRYSPGDLFVNRAALNEVFSLRMELAAEKEKRSALEAENTRLRKMFKTGAVTAELLAMQEHIRQLMTRLNTADVYLFEAPEANGAQQKTA